MPEVALYYPTCADASRAITEAGESNVAAYDEIYPLLVGGKVEGAYQEQRYWRVPVEGLRKLGFDPDTSLALHLPTKPEVVDEPAVVRKTPSRPATQPSEEATALAIISHLQQENKELRLRLEHSQERLAESEKHLKDIRSLLDYMTKP